MFLETTTEQSKEAPQEEQGDKKNFETAITAIHAKICIIESKEITIKIIGSGNWTRDDKIEVYNISIDKEAGEFYKQFIENQINGAKE